MAKTIAVDVTAKSLEDCRAALRSKLVRAIVNSKGTGDHGVIAGLVADLAALETIEPVRVPGRASLVIPDPPHVAEQKEAAADPAKMQIYNKKISRKESIEASKAEM